MTDTTKQPEQPQQDDPAEVAQQVEAQQVQTETHTEPQQVPDTPTEAQHAEVTDMPAEPQPADVTDAPAEPQHGEVTDAPSEPTAQPQAEPASPAVPKPSGIPKPSAIPTPAAMARPAPRPAAPAPTEDHSASAAFGRVDENGVVHVRTKEGEHEVGSYPGASPEEALTYFARKYDELYANAVLLEQRLAQPEVPSKDVADALKKLAEQVDDAAVVGDLDALRAKLDEIQSGIAQKRNVEQEARAAAKAQAKAEREAIVEQAEAIAEQPENKIQWKQSGARMRELLDEWKQHQRSATRLDRDTEAALWQRFSGARNRFDKARRAHFATLDATHAEAKASKERLVAEAERLSTSTDWSATAGAYKRLMDDWRRAGRASRSDDDQLWARFKAAQDAFFAAKDQVVAAEEEQFRGNLGVKEELLKEAEALLPVTDLEQAKSSLRSIQDRWDAAGKVPRADMERIEKSLRRVEQAVRDADEKRWKSSNPEVAARAQGMVDQLERAVADLEADLAKAESSGNESKIRKAREALDARRAWLEQAKTAASEFGG